MNKQTFYENFPLALPSEKVNWRGTVTLIWLFVYYCDNYVSISLRYESCRGARLFSLSSITVLSCLRGLVLWVS